jgi:hypothetical protein
LGLDSCLFIDVYYRSCGHNNYEFDLDFQIKKQSP